MNATAPTEDTPPTSASAPLFQLKRRSQALMVFELHDPRVVQLALRLAEHMAQAPGMFKNTPTVLDLSPLEDGFKLVDFPALISLLDNHGLSVVGVSGGNETQRSAAARARLALFGALPPSPQDALTDAAATPPSAEEASPQTKPSDSCDGSNLVLRQPVRAGQQAYARGGDLVVEAAVNEGAEVIADGDIHIYGALRGRALAGARGRKDARIWCQQLDAELVSINGVYRTRDSMDPALIGKPAVVEIQQDKLIIRPFG